MIQELERKHYKPNAPNKYHIDCDYYSKNTDKIHITNLVRNNNDISILEAVLESQDKIKQRHIVVKIGKENRTIEKEFFIGKILETEKIPGFISYICIFECLDDTHKQKKTANSICTGQDISENHKKVLIMPYIDGGSVLKFEWKVDMFPTLISTIQQVLMSSFVSFYTCGFIHGDFHLDNIMMKKTKKKEIVYNLINYSTPSISIPTNGYKIVILDFDSSWIGIEMKDKIETYWLNIYNMLSRIQTDLRTKTKEVVRMKNYNKLMMYIDTQIQKKGKIENTLQLLNMISDTEFIISENPMVNLTYNPNVFGGYTPLNI
jgi:serine/threonine protein kinase